MLYTEKDLEKSLDRIEVVNFHQEVEVGGVKFWAYTAGHVLGAAMFMIEIAGVKVKGKGGWLDLCRTVLLVCLKQLLPWGNCGYVLYRL